MMEHDGKAVCSDQCTSDSPNDLPSPLKGRGRGRVGDRGRSRGSEQDSAYFSGSQANGSSASQTRPKEFTSGLHKILDRPSSSKTSPKDGGSRTSPKDGGHSEKPEDAFVSPNSPAQKAAMEQSLASLSEALDFVDHCRQSNLYQNLEKKKKLTDFACSLVETPPQPSQDPLQLSSSDVAWDGSTKKRTLSESDEGEERFCVAVSLSDGLVQHTTHFCSTEMGFPENMWVGRSILDFIHIEDRESFSSHVTENIHLDMIGTAKNSFCARIRQYNSLKSGFTVKGRKTRYSPFKLSTFFRGTQITSLVPDSLAVGYLFLTAEPIYCAYTSPLEAGPVELRNQKTTFSTQHMPDCTLSWVDESAISFTGYLTHHVLGHSILEFIHPSDMTILKNIFQRLVVTRGEPGHSEAVRMRTKNRSYITLNSTWSSFINPWTQKLEFVMGKHTVLLGPENIDDFFNATLNVKNKGLTMAGQAIQEDIRKCLTKPLKVSKSHLGSSCQTITTIERRQDGLQSLMGGMQEVTVGSQAVAPTPPIEVQNGCFAAESSDSEWGPNYVQLNYKENITRYFDSHPRTHTQNRTRDTFFVDLVFPSDNQEASTKKLKSGKRKSSDSKSSSGSDKSMSPKMSTSVEQQAQAGTVSCDQANHSRGANINPQDPQPPVITEELMRQHNIDMENIMKQQFKETKRTGDLLLRNRVPLPQVPSTAKTQSIIIVPAATITRQTPRPEIQTKTTDTAQGCMRIENDGSDSSGLYSFLHSTSDNLTLLSSNDGNRKIKKVGRRWRPNRKEPFWNQKGNQSKELVNKYVVPEIEVKKVLESDQLRLMVMSQPAEVRGQLDELIQQIDHNGLHLNEFMEGMQCGPSVNSTSSTDDTEDNSEEDMSQSKRRRLVAKKSYRETMSIFMEEDAPFPEPSQESLARGPFRWSIADVPFDAGWESSSSASP